MAFADIFTEYNLICWQAIIIDNSHALPELAYDDGLQFIYFNTKGVKGGNEAIYNLLKYIQSSREQNVSDDITHQLHQYVSRVKLQPETRLEYMRFDELMSYAQIEGRAEGRIEGNLEARQSMILELLEECGKVPDLLRRRIESEKSEEVLKCWIKISEKTKSIDDFILNIEQLD